MHRAQRGADDGLMLGAQVSAVFLRVLEGWRILAVALAKTGVEPVPAIT